MADFSIINGLHLGPDEHLAVGVRKSLLAWFWPISLAIIFLLLPFFLIFPLFNFGLNGIIVFSLMLIFSLFLFLRIYLSYHHTWLALTDRRLIDCDRRGFFGREISEAGYPNLADVYCRRSRGLRGLLGLGDIFISFKGNDRIEWRLAGVKNFQKTATVILLQQENYLQNKLEERNLEAEYLLDKIRKRLGPEKFERLIAD